MCLYPWYKCHVLLALFITRLTWYNLQVGMPPQVRMAASHKPNTCFKIKICSFICSKLYRRQSSCKYICPDIVTLIVNNSWWWVSIYLLLLVAIIWESTRHESKEGIFDHNCIQVFYSQIDLKWIVRFLILKHQQYHK